MERRAADPILPTDLFTVVPIAAAIAFIFFIVSVMFEIYTYVTAQGTEVYGFGMDGRRYCNGALVPNATLGGNLDGTVLYPVLDGRATFTQSRPDFFIAADMTFGANGQVSGTAVFQQAIYTRGHFPPNDGDSDSCTTTPLTFTASFVGSTPIDINPDGTPAPTTAR